MKNEEYMELYSSLRSTEDIERLAKERGLDEELLLVIYTQKTVRKATKRFYQVKKHAKKMLYQWHKGKALLKIANERRFPPILASLIILGENGISKKQFWKYVREPDTIKDARLRKELIKVAENDLVYSPQGTKTQYERGLMGEKMLQDWLDAHEIPYETEEELRGLYPKTPDCLLTIPIEYNGHEIYWIESKASFGDMIEVNKNAKKQLVPYTDLFGDGMVVYWFGFVDEIEMPEGIYIVDKSFFK